MLGRPVALASVLALSMLASGCGAGASKKAKTDRSRDPLVQMRMAESMASAGRTTEALALLDDAIAAEPENAGFRLRKGAICFGAGRYAEAERALLDALALDRYLTEARNYLGAVYQELARPAEAEREYRLALADPAYPQPEQIYLNLGLLHDSQGRQDDAIQALRRSVEINPKYVKAHYELAGLLEKRSELEEAAREYEVAASGFDKSGEYHYRLAMVYFRLGEESRAREHFRRVLDLSPGSHNSAQALEMLKLLGK